MTCELSYSEQSYSRQAMGEAGCLRWVVVGQHAGDGGDGVPVVGCSSTPGR